MAKEDNKVETPKPVYFIDDDKTKYEVLGKRFFYQGDKYTAEEAVKNKELMAKLIENKAPAIKKV